MGERVNGTKIFGIGFPRTGTTSLAEALGILGYRIRGCPSYITDAFLRQDLEFIFDFVDQYDAFQDIVWPIIYKELDKEFGNSKFILTVRDTDKWIRSMVNYGAYKNSARFGKYVFNAKHPRGNEERYIQVYEKHNREVTSYFRERPDDLLLVDWEKTNGWEVLCPFLDREIPRQPFPHRHKMNYSGAHRMYRAIRDHSKSILEPIKKRLGMSGGGEKGNT